MTTKKSAKTRAQSAKKTAAAKKSASKKTPAKKTPAKKTAANSSAKTTRGRKYSPGASKTVEREMHEMHEGKLKSGRSGKKVTNPKQAIAIALSEARRAGEKVPPNPNH